MMKMLAEEEVCGQLVACIVYDSFMKFADAVANRLKLPSIVLRTTTAAYMHSHNVMFQLLAEDLIPLPGLFKDLPAPATIEIPQIVLDFLHSYMDIRSSSAVIWNTVDQLDHWPLQQLKQHWPVPFFSIGPFHKMAPAVATSLLEEESSCLSWLDKQAPNSVIYASLGSAALIDENELIEMAWGLAKSEQPFLWAVRPSLLNGTDAMKSLPEEFIKITQERGMVVKWAPQKKAMFCRPNGKCKVLGACVESRPGIGELQAD
ncbi:UNVERIFIED_CONTAM: UDP-glycosyltransferase 76E1 [Sesamum latifolium]|uniref:UDP-glycosyltransferase 76E1 n=1 Tax=Sesamum latifolium TaxID=2727402 RepID=A0AAW2Y4F6_9LAMI